MTTIDTVEECKTEFERRMDLLSDGLRFLALGAIADSAERDYEVIALDMGFVHATLVSRGDVYRIGKSPKVQHRGNYALRVFMGVKVVIEAFDDADRKTYIAVEACRTVDRLYTDRAIFNAQFLAEATGHPARAAVYGRVLDPEAEEVIASGDVHWYRFGDED